MEGKAKVKIDCEAIYRRQLKSAKALLAEKGGRYCHMPAALVYWQINKIDERKTGKPYDFSQVVCRMIKNVISTLRA